ncbi:carboxymuconolactone decarboxylase family protein [Sphingobium yanoikuyae]|jgi:4-carboxymuconolactone decarboxylase|uniref:carboxymuconolactone decarboxylase family protein n=1 Tax=Sphingobium yanoikuyae TaxID=13690 RepID=UPI0028A6592B|nr:carboxymuconolactone decarboxylase family protein [Sphingobium yanoikuyae]
MTKSSMIGGMMALAASAAGEAASAQNRTGASVAPPLMQEVAPQLADYTDRVLFGDIWERPGLAKRDRSLVVVATLIATGRTGPLAGHIGRALDNGVPPAAISGLITHLAFYMGWPSAVAALEPVREAFMARKIDLATLKSDKDALLPVPPGDAERAVAVDKAMAESAPALGDLTNDVLFADLWRRSDLSPRDRSLVTIAALAATGSADQLDFHIPLGLRNGLTRTELAEAITHLAFYAGWPRAMSAAGKLGSERPVANTEMIVVRAGETPSQGAADRFTGTVSISSSFSTDTGASGGTVRFEPGARSNWHSHANGQLLVVTQGEGRMQSEGGPVRVMRAGDVVWTPAGTRHWHGAGPVTAMTHVAIVDRGDVVWQEPVTDAQYRALP